MINELLSSRAQVLPEEQRGLKSPRRAAAVLVASAVLVCSRIAIEQAKGMLAERHEVDMGAACTQLRAFARNNNRGLTEVAESLIAGKITVDAIVAKRLPHHRSPTDDPVAVPVTGRRVARATGNYEHGNERDSRNHPRNR